MGSSEFQNWAGNRRFHPTRLYEPSSVDEIQEIVSLGRRVRAIGTRHSFNAVADSPHDLLSTLKLQEIEPVDRQNGCVTVGAGVTYGHLCEALNSEGFAIHNLASLPHISVGGAVATATHGSGDKNGNLSTAVRSLEIVKATGELHKLCRDIDSSFAGAVVGLGALGIVVRLTLDLRPAFEMRQNIYEGLALNELENHFDEVFSSAYSVSLFTSWREANFEQVWLKSLITDSMDPGSEFFGAEPAPEDRHPIPGVSAVNCTAQMGMPGAWYERLPHFRMDFTPSNGDELQTEYIVPRRFAYRALCAVSQMRSEIAPLLHISEIRSIAPDDLWMSPCFGLPGIGIHFTWKKNWPAVEPLLPRIEAALEPFEARPHWGKLFTMPPERVRSRYEKLPEFADLVQELDPTGRFRNDFVDQLLAPVA